MLLQLTSALRTFYIRLLPLKCILLFTHRALGLSFVWLLMQPNPSMPIIAFCAPFPSSNDILFVVLSAAFGHPECLRGNSIDGEWPVALGLETEAIQCATCWHTTAD